MPHLLRCAALWLRGCFDPRLCSAPRRPAVRQVDWRFVLEGRSAAELPERLLAAASLKNFTESVGAPCPPDAWPTSDEEARAVPGELLGPFHWQATRDLVERANAAGLAAAKRA